MYVRKKEKETDRENINKSQFFMIITIANTAVDAAAQHLTSASETLGFHRVASRPSPVPQDIPREYPRELQMFRYRSFHFFENEAIPLFAELKYGNFICISRTVPRAICKGRVLFIL